jgi:hypothetical protein
MFRIIISPTAVSGEHIIDINCIIIRVVYGTVGQGAASPFLSVIELPVCIGRQTNRQ